MAIQIIIFFETKWRSLHIKNKRIKKTIKNLLSFKNLSPNSIFFHLVQIIKIL